MNNLGSDVLSSDRGADLEKPAEIEVASNVVCSRGIGRLRSKIGCVRAFPQRKST